VDIALARTFLQIVETGSFLGAAQRLNLSQSTISMRVKELESQLGQALFERSKAGATLTAAGARFFPHASTMVRAWRQANQEVGLSTRFKAVLAVGGQFSLWDRLLLRWLGDFRRTQPDVAVRAEVGQPDGLMRMISEGLLDIGVMYNPQRRPNLDVEELIDETLVQVTTAPAPVARLGPDYIFVDWGPDFQTEHATAFPELEAPGTVMSLGAIGLSYILENGGSGYFPERVVRPLIDAGTLRMVSAAPVFHRPAYVVHRRFEDGDPGHVALAGLRAVARRESVAAA